MMADIAAETCRCSQ